MVETSEIFALPIKDRVLVYAPLHSLTALVNQRAAELIQQALKTGIQPPDIISTIVSCLREGGKPVPTARYGPLCDPLFLGIIPTRGCNLSCRYCNFAVPQEDNAVMPLSTAREAVDAYIDLLEAAGRREANIHFFGGEPFYAKKVVHFVVEYAIYQASLHGMNTRFEASTNGMFQDLDCGWIADRFDTVVLSLDGPGDIQELHRPAANHTAAYDTIERNVLRLSQSSAELMIRACVTHKSVGRLEETAAWMAQTFRPSTICFEGLTPSARSEESGLQPPDPWEFGQNFHRAANILAKYGIETVLSTADVTDCRLSVCPVGKDALIVSPDGTIDACYLLRQDWEEKELDLHLGRLNGHGLGVPLASIQRVRDFSARDKPLCKNCFCRFHCAGGCHVGHPANGSPGEYDEMCITTRLVTAARLLAGAGQAGFADAWLADLGAARSTVLHANDRLWDAEYSSLPGRSM